MLSEDLEEGIAYGRNLTHSAGEPELRSKLSQGVSWVEHQKHVADCLVSLKLRRGLQRHHKVSDALVHML